LARNAGAWPRAGELPGCAKTRPAPSPGGGLVEPGRAPRSPALQIGNALAKMKTPARSRPGRRGGFKFRLRQRGAE